MSSDAIYCAITFAPVQGFIEKSRKLRDLYGSSFILSYLACAICQRAEADDLGWSVVSPALPNITQGTPNQIILSVVGSTGEAETKLKNAFDGAWRNLVQIVRKTLEDCTNAPPNGHPGWFRSWELWEQYAWEWFYALGQSQAQLNQVWERTTPPKAERPLTALDSARQAMNEVKRRRNWIGVNWQGESSTLSGIDAIAWPGMDLYSPKTESRRDRQAQVNGFYAQLTPQWNGRIIDPGERLNIPDLVKRLVTLDDVAQSLKLKQEEYPSVTIPLSFKDLNRQPDPASTQDTAQKWTTWFMGDGDKIGDYLKNLTQAGLDDATALAQLSHALMSWSKDLSLEVHKTLRQTQSNRTLHSRVIYAGGDDFMGVIYREAPAELYPDEWLPWLYQFPDIWRKHREYLPPEQQQQSPLTVSMGLVWAAPGVPQRDVLQHCREAERSAKTHGRNRVAIRILFNSGTHIEWACPWLLLKPILTADCNWTHFYRDVNTLLARHALRVPHHITADKIHSQTQVAQGILQHHLNLPENPEGLHKADRHLWESVMHRDRWCTQDQPTQEADFGILPPQADLGDGDPAQIAQAFNDWVVDLAKVGFQLAKREERGQQQVANQQEVAA